MNLIFRVLRWGVSLLLMAAAALTVAIVNRPPAPVAIGFIGCGPGEVTIPARDAVILAVEEYNMAGGLGGRAVRLQIRDAGQSAELASSTVAELSDTGVWAIIGPTGHVCVAQMAEAAKRSRILMLSPMATDENAFSDESFFISIYPLPARRFEYIARYLYSRMNFRSAVIFMSIENMASAESFSRSFQRFGGKILGEYRIAGFGEGARLSDIANSIIQTGADVVILLAGDVESGLLAQHLRRAGSDVQLVRDDSTLGDDFLRFGGSAVDGTICFSIFLPDHASEGYRQFTERFYRRFGYAPPAAAVHSYDATRVVLSAVSEAQSRDEVRTILLAKQSYAGLQDRITLVENGDIRREIHPQVITSGFMTSMN